MRRLFVGAVSKLSLMIRFPGLSGGGPFQFDLRDSDILPLIVYPPHIVERGVSVVNGGDIDTEGIRCAALIMLVHHIVELPVSRGRVALAHVRLRVAGTCCCLVVVVVLLVARLNLIQETLELLGDFLGEVIWTRTCKLKDLGLGRGGDLFVASYFLLVVEYTLGSG
jgi:hypothetical protein